MCIFIFSPSFVGSVDGISAFVSRDMILRTPLTTANRGDPHPRQGPSSPPLFSPSEPHRSSRPGSVSSSEGGRSSTYISFYRWTPLEVVGRKTKNFYTIKVIPEIPGFSSMTKHSETARISTFHSTPLPSHLFTIWYVVIKLFSSFVNQALPELSSSLWMRYINFSLQLPCSMTFLCMSEHVFYTFFFILRPLP